MLNTTQRQLLVEAIAKLEEACQCVVDALGESDATQFTCTAIQDVIADLEADIADSDVEDEYDGQPDELTEWMDFDPDC